MKVSIIIPAYNAEKYIKRAIDSVKAQTYTDWECIIIDDASTDETVRIALDETMYDTGFHVWAMDENEGVASTRNMGMEVAKGDAIFFLDADDYMEPNCIEYQVGFLEKYTMAGRIFSPPIIEWPNGKATPWRVNYSGLMAPDHYPFAKGNDYGHVTGSLYLKKALPGGYKFPDVPIYEDLLFNMGLVFAGVTTYVTMENPYHYCRHGDSITLGTGLSVEDARKIIQALNELGKTFNPDRSVFLRCSGFLRNVISARMGEKAKDV